MKKIKNIIILLIAIAGLVLAFYEPAQKALAEKFIEVEIDRQGLTSKTITFDDNAYYYLDNENTEAKDSILFIHGYGGDSINWAKLAPYLEDYRVVALDLIGFGKSEKDFDLNYSFKSQADRVIAFADAIGLKDFNVAGNSMGGGITLTIAINHADKIKSATLFNAAGVSQFKTEWFKDARSSDKNILQSQTPEDFDAAIKLSMSKPPFMPWPILKFRKQAEVANAELKVKMFNEFAYGEYADLIPYLDNISDPVLIIWGNDDKILHVGNADVIDEKVANSEKHILEGIGHLPMMEAPEESAGILLAFLEQTQNK